MTRFIRKYGRNMKVIFICFFLTWQIVSAVAENPISNSNSEKPPDFHFIIGPRIGVSYLNTTPEKFTESVNEIFPDSGEYIPVTSYFGINFEQRLLLGETRSHFAFQELILVSGIEQAIVFPSASFLIGFRAASGFEFGVGPTFSLSGIGVVLAVGWTFSYSGVYIPVDLSMVIPNGQRPMSIALTTGFNFTIFSSNKNND